MYLLIPICLQIYSADELMQMLNMAHGVHHTLTRNLLQLFGNNPTLFEQITRFKISSRTAMKPLVRGGGGSIKKNPVLGFPFVTSGLVLIL